MAKNRKTPDMNLPMWFDGQNINEALFCEEFLQERRIIFANGAFFTPDGRVTDDLPLRGEIYDKLKFCAVNNIPRKITNILEVLKLEAQVPDFLPEQDRIHLSNGISETSALYRIIVLMPLFYSQYISIMSVEQMHNGMLYAVWSIPVAIALVVIGSIISHKAFSKHQVR